MSTVVSIDVYALPRRFDALVWYARLQRWHYDLAHFFCEIPVVGQAHIEVLQSSRRIATTLDAVLPHSTTTAYDWCSLQHYQEPLPDWKQRHPPVWLASASISWILSLARSSWLALARTSLQSPQTTWQVRSAWLVLALGALDIELLTMVNDDCYVPLHVKIYADYLSEGLTCASTHHLADTTLFMAVLQSRSFGATLISRLPPHQKMDPL